MKAFATAIVICTVVIVGGYAGWSIFYHSIHVRYRLTVEVKDGDQLKTGSGVVDISYAIFPDDFVFLDGPDAHARVVGYAVTVELGNNRLLFLTFEDAERTPAQHRARNAVVRCPLDDIGCLPFAAYGKPGRDIGSMYSQQKMALHEVLGRSGPRDVPFAVLPRLVRFLNIDEPNTAVPVSPFDLAAGFGPGVKLNRVILELTNDPVTPPPEIWPDWLKVKGRNAIFRGYEDD
jgi:hypothetical protein